MAVVVKKVEYNFDRTGLPDPVIFSDYIATAGDKMAELTYQLTDAASKT